MSLPEAREQRSVSEAPVAEPTVIHDLTVAPGTTTASVEAVPKRWTYVPELDALRALAMAAVVAFHYMSNLFVGGYLGVTVFFVLSGYLITGLLAAERETTNRIEMKAFYARRWLRLYPALVVVVAIALLVSVLVGHAGVTSPRMIEGAGGSLIYVNDVLLSAGHLTKWFDATWSLGVEEQFYLIWPLLLIVALRRAPAARVGNACLLAGIVIAILYVPLTGRLNPYEMYFSPVGAAMPLLLGCGVALIRVRVSRRWLNPVRTLAAVATVALLILIVAAPSGPSAAPWHGSMQLAALAAAAVIFYLTAGPGVPFLRRPALVWLGRRSYGIYLVHVPILQLLLNVLPQASELEVAFLGISISIALAAVCYRYVEQPFLRRKQRFSRLPESSRTARPHLTTELGPHRIHFWSRTIWCSAVSCSSSFWRR